MARMYLLSASLSEIVMGISQKLNDGRTKPAAGCLCPDQWHKHCRSVRPILWAAIDAIGLYVTGVIWFNERFSLQRLFFISLMINGVID